MVKWREVVSIAERAKVSESLAGWQDLHNYSKPGDSFTMKASYVFKTIPVASFFLKLFRC